VLDSSAAEEISPVEAPNQGKVARCMIFKA